MWGIAGERGAAQQTQSLFLERTGSTKTSSFGQGNHREKSGGGSSADFLPGENLGREVGRVGGSTGGRGRRCESQAGSWQLDLGNKPFLLRVGV